MASLDRIVRSLLDPFDEGQIKSFARTMHSAVEGAGRRFRAENRCTAGTFRAFPYQQGKKSGNSEFFKDNSGLGPNIAQMSSMSAYSSTSIRCRLRMSALRPGCVKTCTRGERTELCSLYSSFGGAGQSSSFLIQRIRDKHFPSKFDFGVFTQPG